MNPLALDIARRIRERGPLPFAAYMSLALYHAEHGYYARSVRTGWHGQFVTSPELDPAFGSLWARGAERLWQLCDRPERFTVVEMGPGEGGFARSLLKTATGDFGSALRYIMVERTDAGRTRQAELITDQRAQWVAALDEIDEPITGVVIANEVVDNLPFHIVERTGGELLEVYADVGGDDGLVETLGPPSTPELDLFLERHGMSLSDDHRAEVSLATEGFIRQAASIVGRGAVIVIDYGDSGSDLLLRPRGTVVCYSATGIDERPLAEPGTKDITAHANWTAVSWALTNEGMSVVGPRPQAEVLRALGAGARDEELKADHDRALADGRGRDAVAALSRRHALRALLDPGGLGKLGTVAGLRGVATPDFLKNERGLRSEASWGSGTSS